MAVGGWSVARFEGVVPLRPSEIQLPAELDERLREWARVFRDRRRLERCRSLEGRFNPFNPGSWDAGWGDPEAVPAYLPPVVMPRVLKTHACVQSLPSKAQRWAVTFGYCYPNWERWAVIKALKKYTGRRFTWNGYLDELEAGRMRVWACLSVQHEQIFSVSIDITGT